MLYGKVVERETLGPSNEQSIAGKEQFIVDEGKPANRDEKPSDSKNEDFHTPTKKQKTKWESYTKWT